MADQQSEREVGLDLGSGTFSISYLKQLNSEYFNPNGQAVLLDRRLPKTGRGPKRGEFVQASALDIPLGVKRGVSTVLAKDLFGSHTESEDLTSEGLSSNIGDFHRIIDEVSRVTKQGGKFIILETLTKPTNLDEIVGYVKESGFSLQEERHGLEIKGMFRIPEILTPNERAVALVFSKTE